ncbi:MAG TPA: Gfo/Idh/MocA family oxidoreductase [Gaiellaceae bacterium]
MAVVGGGLVAQAEHLPYLAQFRDRFELAALVEPGETVREALAARYAIPATCADYRELLDADGVDAVVICSPAGTHAEVVLAALDAGLHVFVEKPMCITLADADAIVAARDRAAKVVQVGYMKRFDPAYELLLEELPAAASGLRYVSVVVNDPEFAPFFTQGEIVRGEVPREVIEATRRAESDQVEAAVGDGSPDVVMAFSEAFLGSLVHDVNLVHGVLERLGQPLPAEVVGGAWWAGGRAVSGSARLANGARWDSAWIQLLDVWEYRESVAFMFDDGVQRLTFPSPWLKQSPTRYERIWTSDGRAAHVAERYEESFARELLHFHACVTEGVQCRTPPEQARLDIDVLTRMFLASR